VVIARKPTSLMSHRMQQAGGNFAGKQWVTTLLVAACSDQKS
jgi:hypothetical protein